MVFTNLGFEEIIQGRLYREDEEEPELGFKKYTALKEITREEGRVGKCKGRRRGREED